MSNNNFRLIVEDDNMNKSFPTPPFLSKAMSLEAKGMLATLFALPPRWKIWVDDIEKRFRISRDKRRRIFRELISTGYLELQKVYDHQTGRICGSQYIVKRRPKRNKVKHEDAREPGKTTGCRLPDRLKFQAVGISRPSVKSDDLENPAVYPISNGITTVTNIQQQLNDEVLRVGLIRILDQYLMMIELFEVEILPKINFGTASLIEYVTAQAKYTDQNSKKNRGAYFAKALLYNYARAGLPKNEYELRREAEEAIHAQQRQIEAAIAREQEVAEKAIRDRQKAFMEDKVRSMGGIWLAANSIVDRLKVEHPEQMCMISKLTQAIDTKNESNVWNLVLGVLEDMCFT